MQKLVINTLHVPAYQKYVFSSKYRRGGQKKKFDGPNLLNGLGFQILNYLVEGAHSMILDKDKFDGK